MTERESTSSTPSEPSPATGVASGNLGTGTAVDDETKPYVVPEIAWRPSGPANVRTAGGTRAPDPSPVPAPVAPVETSASDPPGPSVLASSVEPARVDAAPASVPVPAVATRAVGARRDPFRPIGIALAAVLVGLAGIAALAIGSDPSTGTVVPPATTASPAAPNDDGQGAAGDEDGDSDDGGGGGGGGNGGNGNGRGNGNGNGPGGDNGRGND